MSENIIDKLDREEIRIAPLGKRAWAFLIDDVLISALFVIVYWGALAPHFEDAAGLVEAISNLIVQLTLLKIIYHTFFIWYYGATLGKIALHLVCLDTVMLGKPKFFASLTRACVRVISEWCFYLGFAWALGNPLRQTWQDKLAGTVVCEAY